MDFKDKLEALAAKIPLLCDHLNTEEATKNALIMPFIAALGYDVFDPLEVIPEYTADWATKKGEKVDYAIKKDGQMIMLFECKHCGADLKVGNAGQLFRYFSVTEARIGVLTNGIVFKLFTDLEAPNKMDEKPFLEFNMLELHDGILGEIKKLTKPAFNVGDLLDAAGDLKYTREIMRLLDKQMVEPTPDFVKLFASEVSSGPLTQAKREYFTGITKRSFNALINEKISDRLKSALPDGGAFAVNVPASPATRPSQPPLSGVTEPTAENEPEKSAVTTTNEEREGFYIIKSILRQHVDPIRIVGRDTQSYFGVLLDDNNRKPLARLYFNRTQKYIGLFDEDRVERKIPITDLNEVFAHADEMNRVLANYQKE